MVLQTNLVIFVKNVFDPNLKENVNENLIINLRISKSTVSELSVKTFYRGGSQTTTEEIQSIEVEKGCKLWQRNEEMLDDFPEYVEGSKLFLLPHGDELPFSTTISIAVRTTSDIYIAYDSDVKEKDWFCDSPSGTRKAVIYTKMGRQERIKTSMGTVLSNIRHIRLYVGNKIDLPPTETKKPCIVIFVKEGKG